MSLNTVAWQRITLPVLIMVPALVLHKVKVYKRSNISVNLADDTSPPLSLPIAYGYGFLMVTFVSLLSLIGLVLLPFIRKNSKLAGVYQYISAFLIALGTSAVFSGAIFHLLPRVMQIKLISYMKFKI